uniref:Transcription intermediary factor 1-beta-like n=1 Tax=Paramormyrops kingsleyae TaxID=1676925 RepID=A0A3B3SX71_9TELE|nr:transcription intermediary factor 1-beta-like [Paramormyrops kingsleyae]
MDPGSTEPLPPPTGAAPGPDSLGFCGTCGTFLGPDRNPQLLPCLHSLCQACTLPQGPRGSRRECPVCERSYTSLEVTANRFLKGPAVQSSTQVSKCAGCEDFAVSGWCVECGEALCSICVSAHQRVRVTRDHTVLHQKLPTDSVPTVFCSTHKEEVMKLFCMSCNQLTCRDCQLTYHRNHRYQFLHEAVTTQREQIESLVMRVRQQREMVSQSLQDLDGRLQDLTGLKSKLKDEMQEALVRMRYILMKRSVKLFKDVEGLCGSEVERVTERQATLKKLKARLTYVLAFTDNALETGNDIALLSNKRQIQVALEDILSQNSLPATSMMDVMFHCDQEICSRITKFGKIITKEVPFARLSFHCPPSKAPEQTLHPRGFAPPQASTPYASVLPFSSSNPCTIAAASFPPPPPPPATTSRAAFTSNPSSVPPSSARSTQPPVSQVPSPSIRHHAAASQLQNSKKTWSFHNYQPKKPKLASDLASASLNPSHCFGFGLQPPGSSLSVPPLTLSSPAVVHPVTPSVIIVSDSPAANVLNVSSDVKKTRPFQPSESVHHQTAPELWNMGFSIQSVRSLSDNSPGKDEMSFKSPPCPLPVKAIADSPCERAPPAGSGRESGVDKRTQAAENEPTSTVAEAESLFLVDAGDVEESDQREDQSLCSEKRQKEGSTFSPSNVEGNAPGGPELSKGSHPTTEPPQKSHGRNAWTPSSFRELLERPVNSSPDKTAFLKLQQPTSLWDLLVTDRQAASQSGSSGSVSKHDGSEETGDSRKAGSSRPSELMPRLTPVSLQQDQTADGDDGLSAISAAPEVADALSRTQFPLVSLWRLPIFLPPAGNPLPQFRLLPGSTENRVLLQVTDDDQQFISINAPYMQGSPDHPETECATCRTTGRLWLCAECGRGFHRDCHIPPISSIAWGEWKCLLCQDLSDNEDPYSTERERRPTLSLVDQKKCEYLLLTLLCKKDGDVLERSAQLSSNYIDISLIRGRLLRKLSPSYRTPSEFVSDVWVLLDTMLDVSEETVSIEKLHRFFQENLNKTFGKTLHPSLLRFPDNKAPESQVGAKSMEPSETLKRTQDMATATQDVPEKKGRQDDGCEREDN